MSLLLTHLLPCATLSAHLSQGQPRRVDRPLHLFHDDMRVRLCGFRKIPPTGKYEESAEAVLG